MSPSPHLTALYSRPIILWVEDVVTSAYLSECWNDPDIAFMTAGGNAGVGVVVRSAQADGFGYVFGFVDRDFGASNRPFWHDPTRSAVLIPDVHEIENYLLTPAHLAGCDLNNGRRSAADIEARLFVCAGGMVWWMACRRVLSDLDYEVHADFPSHAYVADQAAAEARICGSGWYRNFRDFIRLTFPAGEITRRLQAAHATAAADFGAGQWRQTYSGKQLLRNLHNWLYTPPGGARPTPAEIDRDLARSVARWQVANRAVSAEVVDLRAALRGRVGI